MVVEPDHRLTRQDLSFAILDDRREVVVGGEGPIEEELEARRGAVFVTEAQSGSCREVSAGGVAADGEARAFRAEFGGVRYRVPDCGYAVIE